jgi:hypothetical protein
MATQEKDYNKIWTDKANRVLLGRRIMRVRYLSDEEMEGLGWQSRPIAFHLDDGTICFLSCDDEGNDGGSLFYQKEGDNESVIPVLY